jgi:Flp pilus assembly pilin Flp
MKTETPEERERRLMEEFRSLDSGATVAAYVCIVAFVAWSLVCFFSGWTIGGAM